MKINELKIGDKVKFIIPKGCQDINRVKSIGIIKNISNIHGFCVNCGDIEIWIDNEKIISKIETITNEKEIFIDPQLLSKPKIFQSISYCDGCKRTFVIDGKTKSNDTFICDSCWQIFERVIKRLRVWGEKNEK